MALLRALDALRFSILVLVIVGSAIAAISAQPVPLRGSSISIRHTSWIDGWGSGVSQLQQNSFTLPSLISGTCLDLDGNYSPSINFTCTAIYNDSFEIRNGSVPSAIVPVSAYAAPPFHIGILSYTLGSCNDCGLISLWVSAPQSGGPYAFEATMAFSPA